jgi:hypothetical protein
MATTTQETRDALRSLFQKVTIKVADLQTINDEQQDLIYKIEVMVGIRSVSVQPSPLPQPSVLLELPPPSPPAEAVAPTDLPPELLPTQPSVQSYALPSTAATPAPVMPVHAASLGFAPMSSPAPQSSGLLKQPAVASASISAMLAPPLASLTLNYHRRLLKLPMLPLGSAAMVEAHTGLSRKEIRIIPACFHGNQEGYLCTSRLEATRNMLPAGDPTFPECNYPCKPRNKLSSKFQEQIKEYMHVSICNVFKATRRGEALDPLLAA